MLKGKDGLRKSGAYVKKGEGAHQFSMTEGSPSKIRKSVGDVKNVMTGREARTQDGHTNMAPAYDTLGDEARKNAARAIE